MPIFAILALLSVAGAAAGAEPTPLSGSAAALYQKALDTGRFGAQARKLDPEVRATSDGRSFYLVWKSSLAPTRWIVSLHGAGRPARGFATDDLTIWHPHLKGRDVGLFCVQWWLGTGDRTEDFLTPLQVYREIDRALQSLGVKPGNVMLEGFSRGSTNTYAVAAIDRGQGQHYFSLVVASSGSVALDYPPNLALLRGDYGPRPLAGTRWITVAGASDPDSERDGVVGMRRTAVWLKEQGAIVLESIEDPSFGHGALHLNPENARRVLDAFLK